MQARKTQGLRELELVISKCSGLGLGRYSEEGSIKRNCDSVRQSSEVVGWGD